MNKWWIYILAGLILFCIIFYLFTQKKSEHPYIKEILDAKGNIIGEIYYLKNDTSSPNKIIKYYLNGNKKEILNIKNNLINGWMYVYNENGTIKEKSEFKNDKANGVSYFFSENGVLESKSFWLDGGQCGDVFYYDKAGRLELYNAIDYLDKGFYIFQLDSSGRKIKQEGLVFSPTLLLFDKPTQNHSIWAPDASLPIGENIEVHINVAQPPGTKTMIEAEADEASNFLIAVNPLPINYGLAILKLTALTTGQHKLIIKGELIDLKSNKILKKDSTVRNILVE